MMNSITLVGCGNMGLSILTAIQNSNKFNSFQYNLIEALSEKHDSLKAYQGSVFGSVAEIHEKLNVVIIAVKPKDAEKTLQMISEKLGEDTLIISVMAGVSASTMQKYLNGKDAALVRVMPNTPCSIQEGMSLFYANEQTSDEQTKLVREILEQLGESVEVDSEKMIDAGTSVSGSGPAYIFYFAENMIKQAESYGFSPEDAKKLVFQTIRGASELMRSSEFEPEELRRRVTSPGGTTEAAIVSFQESLIGESIQKGMQKAFARAEEMS